MTRDQKIIQLLATISIPHYSDNISPVEIVYILDNYLEFSKTSSNTLSDIGVS